MNYLWSTGDIIYWHENYKRLDTLLREVGFTMESLDKLPDHYFIKPWMKYVKVNFSYSTLFDLYQAGQQTIMYIFCKNLVMIV